MQVMSVVDRFSISLLFAITVHVLLLLFVGFDFELAAPQPKTLEITLVQHKTSKPKDADFIAQAHQEGSGTELRKKKLTTTEESPLLADDIYEITIETKNDQVRAAVNNKSKTGDDDSGEDSFDLPSDWNDDDENFYFKAGIYQQVESDEDAFNPKIAIYDMKYTY